MNHNPFKKEVIEDMAPPAPAQAQAAARFRIFVMMATVAAIASLLGYLIAGGREIRHKPYKSEIAMIDRDLRGSDLDVPDAAEFPIRSARAGAAEAQYSVARWYLENRPEESTGLRWMMASARNGYPEAVAWMAYLYQGGAYRPVDRIRSAAWAMIAGEIGAKLPDGRNPRGYVAGLTDADQAKARIVADVYRVEVISNHARRQANITATEQQDDSEATGHLGGIKLE